MGLDALGARYSGWAVPRPGPSGLTVATAAAAAAAAADFPWRAQARGSPHRRVEKMADDIDIEAMLEAPYKKDENKLNSANGHEERSKKRKKKQEQKS